MLAFNTESLLSVADTDEACKKHHYLFVKIKSELYAIPMDRLSGLIESAYVHRSGREGALICGKIDAGSEFVPAIDLGERLNLGTIQRENPCVLLVEDKSQGIPRVWGLILDELLAVMQVSPENIQELHGRDEPCVKQVLDVSGTLVKSLDIALILNTF